jgi:carbamoyltransferase
MNVLGISCYYHDAASTLVRDGEVIAAVEEERFTRMKHDNCFPEQAISYCLKKGNIKATQLDQVCFYEKPLLKLERLLVCGKKWSSKSQELVKQQLSHVLHERLFIEEVLKDKLGYEGKVSYVDHHLAHAASAYFISNFDRAAIMTVDGVGEWATTTQFVGDGNKIMKLQEIRYPHSLGLLYSTMTAFLGFKVNNDEYKVMGLASYGKPTQVDKINKLISFYQDGSFRLNLDYFSFMYEKNRMFSDSFIELFGHPRSSDGEITKYHKDLAASLQLITEDALVRLGLNLYEQCGGTENACLAGGVSLNCVANRRFVNETPFKHVCIQPAAGDSGCAMGAALYAYYSQQTQPGIISEHTTLLGPEYTDEEIENLLISRKAIFTKYDEETLFKKTADLIYKNQIVGWFQGRMEFGPRALGNRSILANACNPSMMDILNKRVKFREDFRPFAPAVLIEKAQEYFDIEFESPYMLFISQVKNGMEQKIPSVTHVDKTARVQTVSKSQNPRFYKLIDEFNTISGVPVVINTSFNIRGEPIVCTPDEAYNCFLKTDIDFLVMGNFLIEKEV